MTNVPKKEQAIAVLLEALEGNQKAEKAVSDLTATQLNVDDGLKFYSINLIQPFEQKLRMMHIVHIQNSTTPRKVIIHPQITIFSNDGDDDGDEHLNHKILEYDMKLPDTVLAFRLLDGAGLSEQQRQMALTIASDLKFEAMRSALKRICSYETSADSTVEMQIKKEEDAFVSVRKRDSFKYGQKHRESQYQGASRLLVQSYLPLQN